MNNNVTAGRRSNLFGADPKADRPIRSRGRSASSESGFTLTELLITSVVFTVIIGSVASLVQNSQSIFRAQQGVADMDQNARLMIDFLTRDIQESKQNAIGLGANFNPIFSYNGPTGKPDQLTILSSQTQTKIPSAALPLIPASTLPFTANDRYLEVLPTSNGGMAPQDVVSSVSLNEQMIVSAVRADGSQQFDIVKVVSAGISQTGNIGLVIVPVQPTGVTSEVPFGSIYNGGAFSMRPVDVKHYYVDRTDVDHPVLAYSLNEGSVMPVGRNIVAFQLRYLQVLQGQTVGQWVIQQNVSHLYTTEAVEVTLTARTEIKVDADPTTARLVTLATVIRPRFLAGSSGQYGAGSPGGSVPGGPGSGGPGGPSSGPGGGDGIAGNGPGNQAGGAGAGAAGYPGFTGGGGMSPGGFNYNTRRIGDPNSVQLNHDGYNNNDQ
jgi:prepilin-type N-terminal cleavage/methylation domain-containing protein